MPSLPVPAPPCTGDYNTCSDSGQGSIIQEVVTLNLRKLHACAECRALHTVELTAPQLEVLDVSACSALTSLTLATPALRELEAAHVRPLSSLPKGYPPQWPVTRLSWVLCQAWLVHGALLLRMQWPLVQRLFHPPPSQCAYQELARSKQLNTIKIIQHNARGTRRCSAWHKYQRMNRFKCFGATCKS